MTDEFEKNFEKISDYLDGELDPENCREIERHLKECPKCRNCLDSLKKLKTLCRETSREKLPPEAHKRLLNTLRDCLNHEHRE
jgi:RNA polymerase sigma-70 factor (ECF subfamily)